MIDPATYNFMSTNTAAANTTAWNNMMAAIPPQGEMILFHPGDYQHNGLSATGKNNLHLFGQGGTGVGGATRLICQSSSADSLRFATCGNLLIENLWVGHGVSNSQSAIVLSGCSWPRVRKVSTWVAGTGSLHGLLIKAVSGVSNYMSEIADCHFVSHPGCGILVHGLDASAQVGETNLLNCNLAGNADSGLKILDYVFGLYLRGGVIQDNGIGVHVAPSTINRTVDVFLYDAIIDDNGSFGLRAQHTNHVKMYNTWVCATGATLNLNGWGVALSSTCCSCEVKNCHIASNKAGGFFHDGGYSMINDNYFDDNGKGIGQGGRAILLGSASQCNMLRNNYFLATTIKVQNLGVNNDMSGSSPW